MKSAYQLLAISITLSLTLSSKFVFVGSEDQGANIELKKSKYIDRETGEDSHLISEDSLVVSDGVGGTNFTSDYTSRMIVAAASEAAMHYANQSPQQNDFTMADGISNYLIDNFKEYNEVVKNQFKKEYSKLEKIHKTVGHLEENPNLIDVSASNDIKYFFDENFRDLKEIKKKKLEGELLLGSATLVGCYIKNETSGKPKLRVFQAGDSIFMKLTKLAVDGTDGYVFYPQLMTNDMQLKFNFPGQIDSFGVEREYNTSVVSPEEDKQLFSEEKFQKILKGRIREFEMPVSESDLILVGSDGLFDNISPVMLVLCIAEALHILGNMPTKDLNDFKTASQILIPFMQEFKNFANQNFDNFATDMLRRQEERRSFELLLKYKLNDDNAADGHLSKLQNGQSAITVVNPSDINHYVTLKETALKDIGGNDTDKNPLNHSEYHGIAFKQRLSSRFNMLFDIDKGQNISYIKRYLELFSEEKKTLKLPEFVTRKPVVDRIKMNGKINNIVEPSLNLPQKRIVSGVKNIIDAGVGRGNESSYQKMTILLLNKPTPNKKIELRKSVYPSVGERVPTFNGKIAMRDFNDSRDKYYEGAYNLISDGVDRANKESGKIFVTSKRPEMNPITYSPFKAGALDKIPYSKHQDQPYNMNLPVENMSKLHRDQAYSTKVADRALVESKLNHVSNSKLTGNQRPVSSQDQPFNAKGVKRQNFGSAQDNPYYQRYLERKPSNQLITDTSSIQNVRDVAMHNNDGSAAIKPIYDRFDRLHNKIVDNDKALKLKPRTNNNAEIAKVYIKPEKNDRPQVLQNNYMGNKRFTNQEIAKPTIAGNSNRPGYEFNKPPAVNWEGKIGQFDSDLNKFQFKYADEQLKAQEQRDERIVPDIKDRYVPPPYNVGRPPYYQPTYGQNSVREMPNVLAAPLPGNHAPYNRHFYPDSNSKHVFNLRLPGGSTPEWTTCTLAELMDYGLDTNIRDINVLDLPECVVEMLRIRAINIDVKSKSIYLNLSQALAGAAKFISTDKNFKASAFTVKSMLFGKYYPMVKDDDITVIASGIKLKESKPVAGKNLAASMPKQLPLDKQMLRADITSFMTKTMREKDYYANFWKSIMGNRII